MCEPCRDDFYVGAVITVSATNFEITGVDRETEEVLGAIRAALDEVPDSAASPGATGAGAPAASSALASSTSGARVRIA
ncbi:hypothetical protein EON67_00640 [archaeon]|nr:MAG: hypothetical protein EON67_00640 [archaeon]